MHILRIRNVGKNYTYVWPPPEGSETFDYFVEYDAIAEDDQHIVRAGFCKRHAYGKNRMRVVIWIDGYPHAEFVGADDFDRSGEVLSEIKIPGDRGERSCRYPNEPIPARYAMFNVEGMPTRVKGPRVRRVWAVIASIADHKTLIILAALRRLERTRRSTRAPTQT